MSKIIGIDIEDARSVIAKAGLTEHIDVCVGDGPGVYVLDGGGRHPVATAEELHATVQESIESY